MICVFKQGKFHFSVFQNFHFCSLIQFRYHQVHVIASIESKRHGPFVPVSMHAELVSFERRIFTIISIQSDIEAFMSSLIFSCWSFGTVVFFESRACPLGSLWSLYVSSIWSQVLVIFCLKSLEFYRWGLMSIVSLRVFCAVNTSPIEVFWAIESSILVATVTCSRQVRVPFLISPRGAFSCTVTFFWKFYMLLYVCVESQYCLYFPVKSLK